MSKDKLFVIRIIWIIMQFGLGLFGITVYVMNHSYAALAAAIWIAGGIRDTYELVRESWQR